MRAQLFASFILLTLAATIEAQSPPAKPGAPVVTETVPGTDF